MVLRLIDINEAEDLVHNKIGELQGGILKIGVIPNQILLLSTQELLLALSFHFLEPHPCKKVHPKHLLSVTGSLADEPASDLDEVFFEVSVL